MTNNFNNPSSDIIGTIHFSDHPGIPITLTSHAVGDEYFNTYFRFKPDGDADNIYVTLSRADWDWYGNVDYTGGFPQISWVLSNWTITGAGVDGPRFYKVNEFPIWYGTDNNIP